MTNDKYQIIFAILIGLFAGIIYTCAEPLKIVSYNVENLFHPAHDTVWTDSTWMDKEDWEWTPEGERRWSYTRYYRKVENIARVLTNIGEWDGVDIVGLQEVENAACLKRLCYTLREREYDFVHYESPDPRGIDVALIYKKARIDTLNSRAIRVSASRNDGLSAAEPLNDELITRDILYVKALIDKKDTLHLFVCHLPSQRGGAAESEWKRTAVKRILQTAIDSLYTAGKDPKIVVMGDFNGKPENNLKGVRNVMDDSQKPITDSRKGTHKYQGLWTCLDQFFISPPLDSLSAVRIYDAEWLQETDERYLGLRPKRTYNGFRYQKDGYSDHLPVVLVINDKEK